MTTEEVTLWIQAGAVVVAVGASIVALVVSWRDRVNARNIAAKDRRAALAQAKLMFDLEALLRLLENQNRGGSTDRLETQRLGAEALSLIGLLGRDRLPRLWDRRVERDDDGLRELFEDEHFPEFKKDAVEVQLAVNEVVREIREIVNRS